MHVSIRATDLCLPRRGTRRLSVALVGLLAAGCVTVLPPAPGIGARVDWSALPGWESEQHAAAWPALTANCQKMPARDARWRGICQDAALFGEPGDDIARAFFETRFAPYAVHNDQGGIDGLITGYYEPLLHGSRVRSARYRYPIYQRPDDLLVVDLGALYPELAGRPVRGRLQGKRVVPYFSRAEITAGQGVSNAASAGGAGAANGGGADRLRGNELLWVDDPVALFFLQVQGSGRVQLPDGALLRVGYADQNGHPYQSIGARLIAMGALKREEVNLDSIRAWLSAHPDEAEDLLNSNPSFVFFALREAPTDATLDGPLGSLGVPLTAERSAAVDPSFVALGSPVWLDTSLPGEEPRPFRRLLIAQDTGGAIKGAVRADVFFGHGAQAEYLAGHMKQPGRIFVLLPQTR
jgi:membrane-bound lytic murein transglycosylase A